MWHWGLDCGTRVLISAPGQLFMMAESAGAARAVRGLVVMPLGRGRALPHGRAGLCAGAGVGGQGGRFSWLSLPAVPGPWLPQTDSVSSSLLLRSVEDREDELVKKPR